MPGTSVPPSTGQWTSTAALAAFRALGAGGIKPCVSAHVGDQFGPLNQNLLQRAFGGSAASMVMGALAARKASAEDLKEIRKLLDEYEKGNK